MSRDRAWEEMWAKAQPTSTEKEPMTILLVCGYLAAIVAANLLIVAFGPGVSVLNAFLFIGMNITARDRLHDLWGAKVRSRMALLIVAGSVLSYLLNHAALRIAVASMVAFAVSEGLDTAVYHWRRRSPWMVRVNQSNVVSAAADSILFPTLAFGAFMPWIIAGQFAAKVFGGALWAFVLRPRTAVAALLLCLAVPARAQIVSIDAGVIHNNGQADAVAELFVASPPIVLNTRLFGIATLRQGYADLAYQAQLSRTIVAGRRGMVALTGGALFLSFRDYKPWGIVGGQASWFLSRNLSVIGVASYTPADDWHGTYLLKMSATGLFVR